MVVADGAQQGLACVLSAIAKPGDVILSDIVTYQGISALTGATASSISSSWCATSASDR